MSSSIAILGIDGIGKSTILRSLLDENLKDVDFIMSPSFHEYKSFEYEDLSRQLELISNYADKIQHFELKALSMYLQVSLYGNIEKKLYSSNIVAFRHPVVDAIVYGDFYLKYINDPIDEKLLDDIFAKFDKKSIIQNYFNIQMKRMGFSSNMSTFPLLFKDIFSTDFKSRVRALSEHFNTSCPSNIIFLDLDISSVLSRLKGRDGQAELHETKQSLEYLRQKYFEIIDLFTREGLIKSSHMIDLNDELYLTKISDVIKIICRDNIEKN